MKIEIIEGQFCDKGRALAYRYIIEQIYPRFLAKDGGFINEKTKKLFDKGNNGDEIGDNK